MRVVNIEPEQYTDYSVASLAHINNSEKRLFRLILTQYCQEGDPFFFHCSKSVVPPEGLTIGPESHSQYELCYLIQGNLTYFIEGRKYTVSPGDMILVAPNDIHTLQIKQCDTYERIVLHFNLDLIRKGIHALQLECGDFTWVHEYPVIPAQLCQEYRLVPPLMELIHTALFENYQGLYTAAKTLELLISLDALFFYRGQRLPAPVSVDPLIQRAVSYINDHLAISFSLDTLARALFVSKSTLCHRFRQTMHIPVNNYVTIKRIHTAAELIRKGMSATDACQKVGYTNYTTFHYNYKQIMGTSPSKGK